MSYRLVTKSGYNMFDMLSMMQKGIRRGMYKYAGFAANELKDSYRKAMWNRLMVISAEDCFGIVTKEIVSLYESNEDDDVSRAVALLCSAKKNRDACYFACNFVLASRKTREITVKDNGLALRAWKELQKEGTPCYNDFGFGEISLFDDETEQADNDLIKTGSDLEQALLHNDADMAGYEMDLLRKKQRKFLWSVLIEVARTWYKEEIVAVEIINLKKADDTVNRNKSNKDEIFISKAAMILMHMNKLESEVLHGNKIIDSPKPIEWSKYRIKPTCECVLPRMAVPDWVFDCHTLKGKKLGKTDWDMTRTEEIALTPKQEGYFDNGSWLYTYEQDLENGDITEEGMKPIREYAKTHEANPLPIIPY